MFFTSMPIGAPLSPSRYLQPFLRYWALSILGSRPWTFRVTWRHRSRDHLIPRYPFPIGALLSPSRYLQPFPRYWPLSVLGSQPWPFRVTWRHQSRDHWTRDGPFPIGPLYPTLSLTVSEIFRPKHHVLIDTMLNRHCACAISRECTPYIKIKYIFQFITTTLPIHFVTFIGPR